MEKAMRVAASKAISKRDLNTPAPRVPLHHYWCRVAFADVGHWNEKCHSHSFFELHLCFAGSCTIAVDGVPLTLQTGDFLLLPPRKAHRLCAMTDDFEKLVWGFTVEDTAIAAALAAVPCALRTAPPTLLAAAQLVLPSAGEDTATLLDELDILFRLISRQLLPQTDPVEKTVRTSHTRTEAIRRFLADNLSQNLSTADIAAHFAFSARQLSRICMAECDMTPGALRQSIQMAEIRRLLTETELDMQEIALRTGFSDRYAMSKAFTRHEGISPAVYRKSLSK